MVNTRSPGAVDEDQYFMFLSPERVPTLAWTRVTSLASSRGAW